MRAGPGEARRGDRRFVDAGYDHVYVHQVGPEQDVFFELYEQEVLPSYSSSTAKSER